MPNKFFSSLWGKDHSLWKDWGEERRSAQSEEGGAARSFFSDGKSGMWGWKMACVEKRKLDSVDICSEKSHPLKNQFDFVSVCMSWQEPEEGTESLGAGLTGSHELDRMGPGNWTWLLIVEPSLHLVKPFPQLFLILKLFKIKMKKSKLIWKEIWFGHCATITGCLPSAGT